jgi:hypothetical protein
MKELLKYFFYQQASPPIQLLGRVVAFLVLKEDTRLKSGKEKAPYYYEAIYDVL